MSGNHHLDSGLRFRPMEKTRFQCPACRAACPLPTEEELPKELERNPAFGRFAHHQPSAGKKNAMRRLSRYAHTGTDGEYRPIAEIVEGLEAIEADSAETSSALKTILTKVIP